MHGGYGYIDEFKVNRLYRAAKVLEIYEGSKEMEKTIISSAILGYQEDTISGTFKNRNNQTTRFIK